MDGDSRTAWSTPVAIVQGAGQGDDHMNLKWLDSSGGRVFAAVKTSFTGATQPLIQLLAMDGTGAWTAKTIATVAECPNRVVVLIDERAQQLRTFATYPKPPGTTNAGVCTSSGGAIYEKSSPLNNINFTTASKIPRIVDADQYVHNASSTKQNLNNSAAGGASTANSGLMVIADVDATSTYWQHFESGGTADTTPPDTSITSGPSGTVTATDATFAFTSSEAGSTFECQLDTAALHAVLLAAALHRIWPPGRTRSASGPRTRPATPTPHRPPARGRSGRPTRRRRTPASRPVRTAR